MLKPRWRSLLLATCLLNAPPVLADDTALDDGLAIYSAEIHQTPMQSWGPGGAIYLGNGLVLTAAHVVGHAILTRPKVVLAGIELQADTVKEGSFDGVDLTLLSIDASRLPINLRMRRLSLCQTPPYPGEQVVTVAPKQIARSVVIAATALPASVRKFDTIIRDVANTGNSGSGVFDQKQKCLLGIMSRKISEYRSAGPSQPRVLHDIAKYFVPAHQIADFIPPDKQF